ncbi:MAG TPA: D-aminoacylase [Patescibacteria group bacterium]|nr:D-aminoacylase [Patescibacteria group bacterium]
MYDILIKNGEVVDGLGKSQIRRDVAIERGHIADISENISESKAKQVLNASGKIVAPGFIDIQNHSDSYWTLFDHPAAESLLSQGITTIIVGNCGSSVAPLTSAEAIKTIQKWHNLAGVNINWSSFAEFLRNLEGRIGVNVGSLVGHATIRRGLVGDAVRPATFDEIRIMDKLLWQALSQGAFGLSMGLVYAHEVNSHTGELMELAQNLKVRDAYLSVHLRSEGTHILESLDEVIEIAKRSEVALKISHFKIRKSKNWHLAENVLKKLEDAYHKGLNVSFDVYPYDTTWAVLYTYMPKWAYEGGRAEILKVLADPLQRKKVLEFLKTQEHDYRKIIIATSEGATGFVGKSVSDIAQNSGVSETEALLNVLAATATQAISFDQNLSFGVVEQFMSSPLAMIATDGAGYGTRSSPNLVHPRCFGAMPKFLSWARDSKKLSLPEAVKKITSQPAKLLGLSDRGVLDTSSIADVVVFDPKNIRDLATYADPYKFSAGIEHVLVNGNLAYSGAKFLGKFGATLRKS